MTTFAETIERRAAQAPDEPHVAGLLRQAWRTNAPVTATALIMLPILAVAAVGLVVDPRLVVGAPAWLKPAKFAISITIYALTVLWAFHHLPAWPRTRAVVGWTTAITLTLEIAIIVLQAVRGTSSHFNIATPFDAILWTTMGTAIAVQTLVSVGLAVALWRAPFTDRAMGWALRLGIAISIVGASSGGLMTQPTAAQLETMRAGHRPASVGAHTVGAPDGGAGLAGTGWSVEHGDLRVPHFIGLHAFQALPLLALALRRRGWSSRKRARIVVAAGLSYALLFALMLSEALRGLSIVRPDGATLVISAGWLVVSALAVWSAASADDASRAAAVR